MLITQLLFVSTISTTLTPSSSEKLQQFWNSSDVFLTEKIVKTLLESCYENNTLPNTIAIFGNSHEFIKESSIIRMSDFLNVHEDYEEKELSNFRPKHIILIEESSEKLHSDLMLLKKTQWWNYMASFFIVSRRSCRNFKETLITTWKMDMINSIYICAESMNSSSLYTLNLMGNYMPHPWRKMKKVDDLNVFHQIFDPNLSCENLNYEKTKFLNGYGIRFVAWELPGVSLLSSKNFFEIMEISIDVRPRILKPIITSMNTTFILQYETSKNSAIDNLSNGTSDLMLNLTPLGEYSDKTFLFPYYHTQIVAAVRLSSEESTLEKILHLWSIQVLILSLLVITIFFSVLTIENNNCYLAILDLIRLLSYTGILTNRSSHSFRIYFTTILIFIIISNGVFQGKISTFLTKPERKKPAESVDELIQLGYKFYTYPGLETLVESNCPKCNVTVAVSPEACRDHVLNGTFNACLVEKYVYQYKYISFPLELIKESMSKAVGSNICRDNWPLYDRFNGNIMRIVESGLIDFWRMLITYWPIHNRQANDNEFSSPHSRPVKLSKLNFAFQLLAIGLSLAAFTLCLELAAANLNLSKTLHNQTV